MKNIIAISLLIVGVLSFTNHAFADDPLAKGKAALQRGDLQAAILAFQDATKDNKKDPQGFIELGIAYLRADSLDQAVAALVQARDLDSANAQIYDLLGDAYMKQNITAGGIEQYKQATTLDNKNATEWLKLGEAQRKARQYTDAATSYLNVIALDSMNVTALRELGNIYYRARLWPNALSVFDRLYRLFPDSLPLAIRYVRVLSENRQCKKLIPVAEQVIQRDETQADVETMLADCYSVTGDLKKAIDRYRAKDPDSLTLKELVRFAKALKSENEIDSAIYIYQKAYQRDTAQCDIFYDYGSLLMRAKKYGEAADMFQKKVACDTSTGYQFASNLNIAMCEMQLKQFEEAKAHIQKSISYRPDNVQAWQYLAQDLAQVNDTKGEMDAYKKVIEVATALDTNGEGTYKSQLGEAYRQVGVQLILDKKYGESIPYLKKALALDPKNCQIALWIGQAYHNSNNLDEAMKWYCKVLGSCPNGKEAKDAEKGLKIMGDDPKDCK